MSVCIKRPKFIIVARNIGHFLIRFRGWDVPNNTYMIPKIDNNIIPSIKIIFECLSSPQLDVKLPKNAHGFSHFCLFCCLIFFCLSLFRYRLPSSLFYPYNQSNYSPKKRKRDNLQWNPDIGWIHRNYRRKWLTTS